jgi:putative aldouronate transport system permease protein
MVNVIAISLSQNSAVMAGLVKLWPVNFTVDAYLYVLKRSAFWRAFLITMERVFIGAPISMFITIIVAYPLSKPKDKFRARSIYVWIFFFTMLFSGGMIPSYLLVRNMGFLDTIWALVLPASVNVFNIILLLNFFRQIPSELEDSAFLDGAGHFRIMLQIYLPTSLAALATVGLFTIVANWNAWFDGLIYMNNPENYPLQTYLRSIIANFDFRTMTPREMLELAKMNVRSVKGAQMIVGSVPILMAYPFLQQYFVKGITLGSVKG